MTDPIGTAQERELIERLRFYGEVYAYQAEAADALESRITEVGRLEQRVSEIVEAHSAWLETDSNTNGEMHACARMNSAIEKARAALSLQRRP